ncbi:MAG: NAD(P)-dependent oxidoreductase [Candidatus Cloacimonetes bacterium]|nr:NAD(P)-dependent oxidoreductase [Candidatus Cloacimonadota bacterium]
MKKIAITGANGFIGSRLSSFLLSQGYDVRCLVRKNSDLSLLAKDLETVFVDYNDSESLQTALKDSEIVIHLAALTRAKTWEEFRKINIDLVETLVNIVNVSSSIEQFIFMSSQAAAGPAASALPKREDEECNPVTMYGNSKLEAEELIQDQCLKAWTILRPVSVFGPGEKDLLEYYKIVNKGIAPLIGMRHKYISLIYVDDLCRLTSLAVGNEAAYNEIFFAAGSENISMAGFAYLISQALNKVVTKIRIFVPVLWLAAVILELFGWSSKRPPVLNREKLREMSQRYWLASNHKAEEILGFTQEATLVKQMQTTINWYKEHNVL